MGPLKHTVVVKKGTLHGVIKSECKGQTDGITRERKAETLGVCARVMEQTHDTSPVRGNKGRSA